MRIGKDRRGAARTRKYQIVKFRIEGVRGVVSYLRDISISGALFHSKIDIPRGCMIQVSILSPAEDKPVSIASKVVRLKATKGIGGFDVGVKFEGITPSDKDYLSRMLRLLNKKSGR